MFQGCWLRGSLGSSEMARATAGAARLTAHGSGAAASCWSGEAARGGRRRRRGGARRFRRLGDGRVARPASRQDGQQHHCRGGRRPQRPHSRQATGRLCADSAGRAGSAPLDSYSMTIADPAEPGAPADTAVTFADLQIHPAVLQAVSDVGYEVPSAIQAATIPALMAGSDVVGLAQTGTGKTAAFAIPILSKIDVDKKTTQALVLAPTRELALQVAEAFSRYGAKLPRITVLPIYGGSSYAVQLAGLRRGAQVVVGTPGRVIDHLDRGPWTCRAWTTWCSTRPTRCCRWVSPRTSSGSWSAPPSTSRWRCSRRPCLRPSARSPPSTCTTRWKSPSRRKPRRRIIFRSATSWSTGAARWTR